MVQVPRYPSRDNGQQRSQDGRFSMSTRSSQRHDQVLTVPQALSQCAGVQIQDYVLFTILENGQPRLYSSCKDFSKQISTRTAAAVWAGLGQQAPQGENSRSFSGSAQDGNWSASDGLPEFDSYRSSDSRRRRQHLETKSEESDDSGVSSRRKRARASDYGRRGSDDAPCPSITSKRTQQFMIGDSATVEKFYITRFKDMQQLACKTFGKAAVKLMEPKKQTNHPYTRGNEMAPEWWPPLEDVMHKEPDHLLKMPRITLLVWIVKMVARPIAQQHPSIQHLELNVRKLELVTYHALKQFFNAKPKNMEKKRYLDEIFKIAKQEERYLDRSIDADTYCNVMFGDDEVPSEDEEDDDQDEAPSADSPGSQRSNSATSANNLPIETETAVVLRQEDDPRSAMFQHPQHHHVESRAPTGYPTPLHSSPGEHQVPFNDSSIYSRSVHGYSSAMPNESDRRQFESSMYPNGSHPQYGWNSAAQGFVTQGPMTTPYFTSSQHPVGPMNPSYHLPPMNHGTTLPVPTTMSHVYETTPRYEMSPAIGNQPRVNNIGLSHSQHGLPMTDFLHDDNNFASMEEFKSSQGVHHNER